MSMQHEAVLLRANIDLYYRVSGNLDGLLKSLERRVGKALKRSPTHHSLPLAFSYIITTLREKALTPDHNSFFDAPSIVLT